MLSVVELERGIFGATGQGRRPRQCRTLAYVPDVVQLDYELRPKLWVECGECTVQKLDRLAVKVISTAFGSTRGLLSCDFRRQKRRSLKA